MISEFDEITNVLFLIISRAKYNGDPEVFPF